MKFCKIILEQQEASTEFTISLSLADINLVRRLCELSLLAAPDEIQPIMNMEILSNEDT